MFIFCSATFAQAPPVNPYFEKYIFNFGGHTEFFNNVQIDDSGKMRKLDFSPTVGLGISKKLESGFFFLPEFNWVLPRKAGSSKIIKNLFMLRADLGYMPIDWFAIRLGTSVMWLNQHGSGGSTQISNGTGTSTFYYPDENRSSYNNTLDLGIEAFLNNWSLRLQTYTYSLLKQERRQISYSLFISYSWER